MCRYRACHSLLQQQKSCSKLLKITCLKALVGKAPPSLSLMHQMSLKSFFHQDILECARFIFGNSSFRDDMLYSAAEYFEPRDGLVDGCEYCDGLNRIYCKMNSSDLWIEEEVCNVLSCFP